MDCKQCYWRDVCPENVPCCHHTPEDESYMEEEYFAELKIYQDRYNRQVLEMNS